MSEPLEFTKITSNMDADNKSMQVWLWDLGPTKPEPPRRPSVPKGEEGDPAYDLGMVDFRIAMETYEAELKAYRLAKIEYEKWNRDNGGPIEIMRFSCDANDALERDPDRYCISSRTRGHSTLKNGGLPDGKKPGHGQAENLRRQAEGDAELLAQLKADPIFGSLQETRR